MTAPSPRPSPTAPALPTLAPSCARSKLTALINAPAPKASTTPIMRSGHERARPSTAPATSDEAARAPQPSAAPIAQPHAGLRLGPGPSSAFSPLSSLAIARAPYTARSLAAHGRRSHIRTCSYVCCVGDLGHETP